MHRLRALRFLRQTVPPRPPTIGCASCKSDPSANRSAAFCCSLHGRVVNCSHGDRFGKSVAESTKLALHVSEAGRRDAQMPAACQQPAPRPQTSASVGSLPPAFLAHKDSNITPPCCSIRHTGGLALQPPVDPRPGESSRDDGHLTLTPVPAIVQSNKLQKLPSLSYMQAPPYN